MNDAPTVVSNDSLLRSNTNFIYHNYTNFIKKLQTKQGSSSKNSSTKYPKTNSKSINGKSTFISNSFFTQKPELYTNTLVAGANNNELRVDYFGTPIKKGKPTYHHISFIDFIDSNKSIVSEHLIQSFKLENTDCQNSKRKYFKAMSNNGNNRQCCCVIY